MFLVALYTLLRLQRCYPRRLAWILDNSAFTENGVKRSTRILKSLQGDAEAGKKDKMAVGDVYESSSPRDYALKTNKMNELERRIERVLASRKERGLLRRLGGDAIATATPTTELIDFSTNDYLSLSRNKQLIKRVKGTLSEPTVQVLGSKGSRLLDGDSALHRQIEGRLSNFYRAPDALLFNSGYDANVSLFSTLPDAHDVVIYDELIHASVHDGMRSSRTRHLWPCRHSDVKHLAELVGRARQMPGATSTFVALESVYSMDGDVCPLQEVVEAVEAVQADADDAAERNVHMIVDEAHATGYMGGGRGLVSQLELDKHISVKLNTFGKALCAAGAVVCCTPSIRHYLINYARPLIFSTCMSMSNLHTIDVVHRLLAEGAFAKEMHSLEGNSRYLKGRLGGICGVTRVSVGSGGSGESGESGATIARNSHNSPGTPGTLLDTPISPILTPHSRELAGTLQKRGFLVRPVTFPTVPRGSDRVRVCVHAHNTKEEIDGLVREVERFMGSRSGSGSSVSSRSKLLTQMDHHNHGDMDMDMGTCKMDMLWNWSITDRCVVFESWHITTFTSAIFSLLTITLLAVLFEWLRWRMRVADAAIAASLAIAYNVDVNFNEGGDVEENVTVNRRAGKLLVPKHQQIQRSLLYAVSAALSFFLMLVFMTYNAPLIAAVILGAGVGHYVFHREIDVASLNQSSVGCHL
ncbi:hypothetical protein E3P86_00561 [Wallemia ichthyophaga]|uniref:Aminotransferase class I/classII large domain-containing protein n=1 Tax=Wallemia ichthyophaga TaxID=245174 RepID=A0A4V6TNW1_WALIC|nr:hypothetical protein E3P86_00561 [Wallemia ichthyophaga]